METRITTDNAIEWRTTEGDMESEDVVENIRREVEMIQDKYNKNNVLGSENTVSVIFTAVEYSGTTK